MRQKAGRRKKNICVIVVVVVIIKALRFDSLSFSGVVVRYNCDYFCHSKCNCIKVPCSNKMALKLSNEKAEMLKDMATLLRIHSVESTNKAKSGHPTSCASMAETMAVLFFDIMR